MLKFYRDAEDFSQAACKGYDPELFTPYDDIIGDGLVDPYAEARKICAQCPIQDNCLSYALRHREYAGMWGGKSPRERSRIKVHRPAV